MTGANQLPLPLPARPALGRGDYFVSDANALAVTLVETWRQWPGGKCLLTGATGSGKTHLAHVWAADSGARIVSAADLPQADIPALTDRPVCVEDVDRIAGLRVAEQALFHLHNLLLAQGRSLLMTSRRPPGQLPFTLPDLQSRLQGAASAQLGQPDDALLGAVLAKLFADRQIVPAADVIPYLVRSMQRSYAAAQALVAAIDAAALARKGAVTRPLAARVMASLADDAPDGQE